MVVSDQPRWLVVRDQFNIVVEVERLEPGCDLWVILREVMETRAQRGWLIEEEAEPRYGTFFCRKDNVRLFIEIFPIDPNELTHGMYGPGAYRPK